MLLPYINWISRWRIRTSEKEVCVLIKQYLTHGNLNNKVTEDDIGKACSKNVGEEECIQDIGGKARRKETTRKTKM
jgi:hypothetical protein